MSDSESSALRDRLAQLLTEAVAAEVTPSAVCAVAVAGRLVEPAPVGEAVRFDDDGAELPPAARTAATLDTVYDLASVSKIFTALTALTLVRDGLADLDKPLGSWLPAYRSSEKQPATVRHLLTHTAGLPATWDGWRQRPLPARSAMLAEMLELPLVASPGRQFTYSCVGYNTILALAEQLTGQPWADLVQERVLTPLRRADPATAALTYRPMPEQCAATEYQPEFDRGMVRGIVHDESAAALGGAAGNAGLFGTARALLGFAEWLRTGMTSLLPPDLAGELWKDQLPGVLGPNLNAGGPGYGHGLGLRIGQAAWMSPAGTNARGHNGFTGTSVLVDRAAGISVVLLTNRVHPSRTLSDVQPLRAAVADAAYGAAARTAHHHSAGAGSS